MGCGRDAECGRTTREREHRGRHTANGPCARVNMLKLKALSLSPVPGPAPPGAATCRCLNKHETIEYECQEQETKENVDLVHLSPPLCSSPAAIPVT
eukprot:scaffold5126_cov125-Isochrysis_galbana.AAC.12